MKTNRLVLLLLLLSSATAFRPEALASQIFGLYSGFIYFTPLLDPS
jgi:hypothetical protein